MTSENIYSILESEPHNPHYLKRYFKFVLGCQSKNQNLDKFEKHHICPIGIFNEYKNFGAYPWNKIKLSYRQHYIAHWLLWKSYGIGTQCRAFHSMQRNKYLGDRKVNSKTYSKLKYENSKKNHPLTGKTFEERFGVERSKLIREKMSGENASAKLPHSRKANSDSKQNRIWVTDGISLDRWVDTSNIPDGFDSGRVNTSSTISSDMINRFLNFYGYKSEEEFKKILTKEVLIDGLSRSQLELKYKKDSTISRRDPRIFYFLKKFDLHDKLKRGKPTGAPKGTKHFNETQVFKTLNYFGYSSLEEFKIILIKEIENGATKNILHEKYVKEFPSSRDVGIDYFIREFDLQPVKNPKSRSTS